MCYQWNSAYNETSLFVNLTPPKAQQLSIYSFVFHTYVFGTPYRMELDMYTSIYFLKTYIVINILMHMT